MDERRAGETFVAIRVSENLSFERDGRHLYIEAPIPFDISVIGGSIQIPTLENSISLKILILKLEKFSELRVREHLL